MRRTTLIIRCGRNAIQRLTAFLFIIANDEIFAAASPAGAFIRMVRQLPWSRAAELGAGER